MLLLLALLPAGDFEAWEKGVVGLPGLAVSVADTLPGDCGLSVFVAAEVDSGGASASPLLMLSWVSSELWLGLLSLSLKELSVPNSSVAGMIF